MKKKLIMLLCLLFSTVSIYAEEVPKEQDAGEKKEAVKKSEKLEITGRVQARMMMGQMGSGYADAADFDAVDFNFRRIRFGAKYQPVEWAGTVVDVKVENLIKLASTASPVTVLGGLQEANVWVKPGFLGSVIKIGQFKVPFIREMVASSANTMFPERVLAGEAIKEFDIGLILELQPLELIGKSWAKKLDLAFSITNGDGSGIDGVGNKKGEVLSGTDTIGKLINWRVQFNPFGGPVTDGKEESWKEGMEIFSDNSVLWSIGAAGSHTDDSESGIFSGAYNGFTFDTTFYAYGIYVAGEFTTFTGAAVPAGGYMSFQGTLGYNLKLGDIYLMPVARYDYVNDDSAIENSIWFGVNLFALKHNLKFQVFYNLLTDNSGASLNKDVLYFQVASNFGKKI